MSETEEYWHCYRCKSDNDIKSDPEICPACKFSRKKSEDILSGKSWFCEKCADAVPNSKEKCPICGTKKPGTAGTAPPPKTPPK